MHTNHFHVELDQQAKMGDFKNSQSLDCDAPYFYDHEAVDLNPEGIQAGVSLSQGRPSPHRESDTLFVGGKTYFRNTSNWENATLNGDARPDWFVSSMPRDPTNECTAMKRGESLGYVSYDTILKEGQIEYLGKQRINGQKCSEYNVAFSSRVLKGMKVCLGSSDDLPYRVVGEDYTAIYGYGPVSRLPVPGQAPAAASSP